MKKPTKALYAGATGLMLLISTGGTFATWLETTPVSTANAATGRLDLTFADDVDVVYPVTWTLWRPVPNHHDEPGAVYQTIGEQRYLRVGQANQPLNNLRVHAGDLLVGYTAVAADLAGETLVARFEPARQTWDAAADPVLDAWLRASGRSVQIGSQTTEYVPGRDTAVQSGISQYWTPSSPGADNVPVIISIRFPAEPPAAAGEAETLNVLRLGNVRLRLQQVVTDGSFQSAQDGA